MFCAQCISRLWTLAGLRIAIRCLRCGIYEVNRARCTIFYIDSYNSLYRMLIFVYKSDSDSVKHRQHAFLFIALYKTSELNGMV